MFLTQRFRNYFLTATLVVIIGTIVLITGCQPSFAATVNGQFKDHSYVWVVATNSSDSLIDQAKDKIQTGMDRLTNKTEQKAVDEANQMESKTRSAIRNSISNPDYQPSGKSKETNRQDKAALKTMENKVDEAYN